MSIPSFQWAGHAKRWAALARAFERDRVPQTLLVSGPPQIGKWTLVKRYAQLLLCVQPERDEDNLPAPCGECRACHQVEVETPGDFYVYRPLISSAKDKDEVIAPRQLEGSAILIEKARDFEREAMRRPIGLRKVMIIVQAERMTHQAQNALLKTFEEPAAGLTIILLADNPSGLLATVRSRCWHLPLSLTGDDEISSWLQTRFPVASSLMVARATAFGAGRPGRAHDELARLAQGSTAPYGSTPDEVSRTATTLKLVERILHSQTFGALGLSEEALKLADEWWKDDLAAARTSGSYKAKTKSDAKVARSTAARFLDELALAYRSCWAAAITDGSASAWADGLDLIRKTRHYILRNASTSLALDVLFVRLIGLHRAAMTPGLPFSGRRDE